MTVRSRDRMGVLGVGVDRRQRVVEDEDPRIGEQRAGESDTLLLSSRQSNPAFADRRVQAARKDLEVALQPRHIERVVDPERRRRAGGRSHATHVRRRDRRHRSSGLVDRHTERHVVRNGGGEEKRLLGHVANRATEHAERQMTHIHTVEEHRPGRWLEQARQ